MLRTLSYLVPLATFGAVMWPAAAAPVAAAPSKAAPRGELARRIEMDRNRMLAGGIPEFTADFILADVALLPDKPRRFSNYSGDLSGRYIEALSCLPGNDKREFVDKLVMDLIQYQKPDGRFGDASLQYVAKDIALDHMALLWGNGRLLVGLVENYAANPRPEVLASARKLGDFLLGVHEGCANDEVKAKVKDLAAAGMICFSQLIEGFVLLSNVTGEKSYLDGAERIVPWLPTERGKQHSHGYLTTLRAILLLHEATHDAKYLDMVEKLYGGLVHSGDYTLYGGVQELFGGKWDRDEGCSEGDFLRLSLQLWRVTGKMEYLDRAEYCLQNQFYANQFATGDFGHHCYERFGEKAIPGVGRAWWCCTMHGLRSFRDVLDAIVTSADGVVRVNLYADAVWADNGSRIAIETSAVKDGRLCMRVTVDEAPADGLRIAVRKPAWADAAEVRINGQTTAVSATDGYITCDKPIPAGQQLAFTYTPRCEFVKNDGTCIPIDQLGKDPIEAALRVGPWLMGVDEASDLMFYGEPWGANAILLPEQFKLQPITRGELSAGHLHVSCEYVHDGFFGTQQVTLRPLAERSAHEPMTFAVRPKYARQP